MPERSLHVHVFTPQGPVLQTLAVGLRARDQSGAFGIRPGHQPMATALAPCILEVDEPTKEKPTRLAVDGGLLILEGDRLRIATREAVSSSSLESLVEAVTAGFAQRRRDEAATRRALLGLEVMVLRSLSREALHAAAPRRSPSPAPGT